MDKISLGRKGESLARVFLKKKGYNIVGHNFRCRFGEIDLILRKKQAFRFIEVKYRRSEEYGLPQESVQKRKQAKIRKTAVLWLKLRQLPMDTEVHFDVLAINQKTDKISYDYIEDAF
ncbi:MAG: YraN family protein [bacterium]